MVYCFATKQVQDETEKDNRQTVAGISNDLKRNKELALFPSSCAKKLVLIHLIPKWPPFQFSFAYLQISPCFLVLKLETQKNIFP